MRNLSNIGRIFYGLAVAETGLQTIYFRDFPYWLLPPKHSWIPGLTMIAYISGVMLIAAGVCIIFEKKIRQASLLLGGTLLLTFCFYYIPYQFIVSSNYLQLVDWENAAKELAFASGAFVIAGSFSEKNEHPFLKVLGKVIPLGSILFAVPIIIFGLVHLLYAKDVSTYVPSWVPSPLFWAYFVGVALLGSGIPIILRIRIRLIATLLGMMIFSWVVTLHIPRVIVSPVAYLEEEVTSAFIALAYSGIAFVIAGVGRKGA